jgi:hypothetical protein
MINKLLNFNQNHQESEYKSIQNGTDSKIYKKNKYTKLIKLIKMGNFVSVRITAQAIGVSPQTLQEWLKTPSIIEAVREEIDSYVSKIRTNTDWKAQAYLLDKITKAEEHGSAIQINNFIDKQNEKYNI